LWPILRYYKGVILEILSKITRYISIADNLVEIVTGYLRNSILDRYRYANLQFMLVSYSRRRDSSVSIVTEQEGFDSRQGQRFSFHHRVQTIDMQWAPGALYPKVGLLRSEVDHSPPSSAEVKNAWSYTSTPST
jgi:hypothetical protein